MKHYKLKIDELKKIISKILDIPTGNIGNKNNMLKDFNADSLEILKIVSVLESKYDIEIDIEELSSFDTIESTHKYLRNLINKKDDVK